MWKKWSYRFGVVVRLKGQIGTSLTRRENVLGLKKGLQVWREEDVINGASAIDVQDSITKSPAYNPVADRSRKFADDVENKNKIFD